jgi:hypothetical protein
MIFRKHESASIAFIALFLVYIQFSLVRTDQKCQTDNRGKQKTHNK